MSSVVRSMEQIGAIQFGQFETEPGVFAPYSLHMGLLPSYPSVLRALASELAPLVSFDGFTHLLTTPTALPLAVAVSQATDLPLVYPAPEHPKRIEGAYDFDVPCVLLTDVLLDGKTEKELIAHVHPMGLEVKAVVAALALKRLAQFDVPLVVWRQLPNILPEMVSLTPSMRAIVLDWLRTL